MKSLLFTILTITLSTNCNNLQSKNETNNETQEFVTKTGNTENIQKSNCNFLEPDTSLSGIILRNPSSVTKIIGANNKIDSLNQNHFYSKDKKEILTLTQHSGDENNQISIFKVELAYNANKGFKKLNIDSFKSEKGIKLGITKSEVITLLGNCNTTLDSTNNSMILYYLIEQPKDSETKFLAKNNMPIYFAKYEIKDDKVISMEFGFENP